MKFSLLLKSEECRLASTGVGRLKSTCPERQAFGVWTRASSKKFCVNYAGA